MSAAANGRAKPAAAAQSQSLVGDRSLRGWLVIHDGNGGIIGRVVSRRTAAEVEGDIRSEMSAGATPSVTLCPVFKLYNHRVWYPAKEAGGAPIAQAVCSFESLAGHLNLGPRSAKLPFHALLAGPFAFLSELDEDARKHVCRWIEDSERQTKSLATGVLEAG
jgi:hypothetical protein